MASPSQKDHARSGLFSCSLLFIPLGKARQDCVLFPELLEWDRKATFHPPLLRKLLWFLGHSQPLFLYTRVSFRRHVFLSITRLWVPSEDRDHSSVLLAPALPAPLLLTYSVRTSIVLHRRRAQTDSVKWSQRGNSEALFQGGSILSRGNSSTEKRKSNMAGKSRKVPQRKRKPGTQLYILKPIVWKQWL